MSLPAAELDGAEREAIEAELRCLADDEFVLAERYTEWQVRGPTLEADVAVANIAQDELGHARLWYRLLESLGYDETELVWERDPTTFRHSTLVERPFESGDWADCIVRGFLYDTYEQLRVEALEGSSYPAIADPVGKVLGEETFHREHARNWLERLCEDAGGRDRVQDAVDRLFPHALTLFEPTGHEEAILDRGVRARSLPDVRREWREVVTSFLVGYGIEVPRDDPSKPIPEATGRDGSHTNAWAPLYEEFTATYRLLERDEAKRLLPGPDEKKEGADV